MGEPRRGLARVWDYHTYKSAMNRLLYRQAGGAARPVFHDIGAVRPELDEVTRRYEAIRKEFLDVYHSGVRLPRYHEIDPGEREISDVGDPSRKWSVYMLSLLGHEPAENRKACPQTCAALARVPDLIQAYFSVLDPGKSVPRHEGPYLGYLRYHLALQVPAQDPPMLRVAGREHVWRPGEAVLFDDSWPHEVVNHSREVRAVLVVDVLRPLRGLAGGVNRVMTNVVARHTYGRAVARRVREHQAARR